MKIDRTTGIPFDKMEPDRKESLSRLYPITLLEDKFFPYPGISPTHNIEVGDYVKIWVHPSDRESYSSFYMECTKEWLLVFKKVKSRYSNNIYYSASIPNYPNVKSKITLNWYEIQDVMKQPPSAVKKLSKLPDTLL